MQLIISNRAARDLKKLPKNDKEAIVTKLNTYAQTGAGDVKKLVGSESYRLRHGNYRAIFTIENNILVLRIMHRKEIYR